jgi:hypothetical protein
MAWVASASQRGMSGRSRRHGVIMMGIGEGDTLVQDSFETPCENGAKPHEIVITSLIKRYK